MEIENIKESDKKVLNCLLKQKSFTHLTYFKISIETGLSESGVTKALRLLKYYNLIAKSPDGGWFVLKTKRNKVKSILRSD